MAFEYIFNKYKKQLVNFIYRFLGSQETAEDLAQEVFLKVYRNRDRYKPEAKFSTYLYRIASNLCIDYARKHRHEKNIPLDNKSEDENSVPAGTIVDSSQDTPDKIIEKNGINQIIQSALLSLPENQRLAFELKVFDNKSYLEISKIMNCSVPAVESLIFRARQNLKKTLSV